MRLWLSASLLTISVSCGTAAPLSDGDAGGPFPHGEDYLRQHAIDALEDDAGCMICHGLTGDTADTIQPGLVRCDVCHEYEDATTTQTSSRRARP